EMSSSTRSRKGPSAIRVPFSLLFSKELTPATKLLWMRIAVDELHRRQRSHRPESLAKRTFLARSTVYEALDRGKAKEWLVPYRDSRSGKLRFKAVCPVRD